MGSSSQKILIKKEQQATKTSGTSPMLITFSQKILIKKEQQEVLQFRSQPLNLLDISNHSQKILIKKEQQGHFKP